MAVQGSSHDADAARVLSQQVLARAWAHVAIGVVVYLAVAIALWIGPTPWVTGARQIRMSVVISLDFSDGMAILGVLIGAIVAFNLLVWQSIRGASDPRAYGFAQLMELPAMLVGQAAVFVSISTLVGFAPNTIDLPRMTTTLIASLAVVVLAVHTSEGLSDGVHLQNEIRRSIADTKLERLGNVLSRWPLPASRPRSARRARIRWWLTLTAVSLFPLLVAVVWRASVDGDIAAGALRVAVALGVALVLSALVGIGVTTIAASFVMRDFGTALYLTFVLSASLMLVALGVLLGVVEKAAWSALEIATVCCVAYMFLIIIAVSIVSLTRRGGEGYFGVGPRWAVRNSVLREIGRQRRVGSTPDDRHDLRRTRRFERFRSWFRAATGLPPTH